MTSRTVIRGFGEAGGAYMRLSLTKNAQASFDNHADSREEGPAALQNEPCVPGVGM
jgi:hypothetical protein